MDVWDNDVLDIGEEPHLTFKGASDGEIAFVAVKGFLDVRYGSRDGSACAEFSWQGCDDADEACGRGWAMLGPLAGSSVISSSIRATIRGSSANAHELFNGLIGRRSSLPNARERGEPPDREIQVKIIDAHVHVLVDNPGYGRNLSVEELIEKLDENSIDKAIIVQSKRGNGLDSPYPVEVRETVSGPADCDQRLRCARSRCRRLVPLSGDAVGRARDTPVLGGVEAERDALRSDMGCGERTRRADLDGRGERPIHGPS